MGSAARKSATSTLGGKFGYAGGKLTTGAAQAGKTALSGAKMLGSTALRMAGPAIGGYMAYNAPTSQSADMDNPNADALSNRDPLVNMAMGVIGGGSTTMGDVGARSSVGSMLGVEQGSMADQQLGNFSQLAAGTMAWQAMGVPAPVGAMLTTGAMLGQETIGLGTNLENRNESKARAARAQASLKSANTARNSRLQGFNVEDQQGIKDIARLEEDARKMETEKIGEDGKVTTQVKNPDAQFSPSSPLTNQQVYDQKMKQAKEKRTELDKSMEKQRGPRLGGAVSAAPEGYKAVQDAKIKKALDAEKRIQAEQTRAEKELKAAEDSASQQSYNEQYSKDRDLLRSPTSLSLGNDIINQEVDKQAENPSSAEDPFAGAFDKPKDPNEGFYDPFAPENYIEETDEQWRARNNGRSEPKTAPSQPPTAPSQPPTAQLEASKADAVKTASAVGSMGMGGGAEVEPTGFTPTGNIGVDALMNKPFDIKEGRDRDNKTRYIGRMSSLRRAGASKEAINEFENKYRSQVMGPENQQLYEYNKARFAGRAANAVDPKDRDFGQEQRASTYKDEILFPNAQSREKSLATGSPMPSLSERAANFGKLQDQKKQVMQDLQTGNFASLLSGAIPRPEGSQEQALSTEQQQGQTTQRPGGGIAPNIPARVASQSRTSNLLGGGQDNGYNPSTGGGFAGGGQGGPIQVNTTGTQEIIVRLPDIQAIVNQSISQMIYSTVGNFFNNIASRMGTAQNFEDLQKTFAEGATETTTQQVSNTTSVGGSK